MKNKITIEPATLDDVAEIFALQRLAYQSEAELHGNYEIQPLTQSLAEVEEEFHNRLVLKAVAEDGTIVGSVRGYEMADGSFYVGKLIVHPAARRQGLGTRLLLALEEAAPSHRYELFTAAQSPQNIACYEKLGYRIYKRCEGVGREAGFPFVCMEKLKGKEYE